MPASTPATWRCPCDLKLAAKHGVRWAHLGWADREQFAGRELALSEQATGTVPLSRGAGGLGLVGHPTSHRRTALYNQLPRGRCVARPIMAAAEILQLPVMGLPGSRLELLSSWPSLLPRGSRIALRSTGRWCRSTDAFVHDIESGKTRPTGCCGEPRHPHLRSRRQPASPDSALAPARRLQSAALPRAA